MSDDVHADGVKLRRVAKGARPRYFADPATDKLLTMVLELTQELSVSRDRIDTLERLIEAAGLFPASAVDHYLPTDEVRMARADRRAAMLSRVFRANAQELDAVVAKARPTDADIDDIMT